MATLQVRVATADDVESLVRLGLEFRDYIGRETPSEATFRAGVDRLLRDGATEFAIARDELLGDVAYVQSRFRDSAWNGGLEAELEDVFVAAAARGRGVGGRILEFALDRARGRGCRSVGLTTNERNREAMALYRRLGFRAERARWNGGRQLWLELALVA